MKRYQIAVLVIATLVACSYANGKGDAEKFIASFVQEHMTGAKSVHHTCQTRDTDDNDYVSCTLTVDRGVEGERPEIVPLECAVNRFGSGCNNEGCRPLAAFGRPGRKQ